MNFRTTATHRSCSPQSRTTTATNSTNVAGSTLQFHMQAKPTGGPNEGNGTHVFVNVTALHPTSTGLTWSPNPVSPNPSSQPISATATVTSPYGMVNEGTVS